jgi:hypothetical protein
MQSSPQFPRPRLLSTGNSRCAVQSGHNERVLLIDKLVDALPERLWAPGNLYMLPGGDWHFCVGSRGMDSRSVRTVEWRGRKIAHGVRSFSFAAHDSEDVDIGE